MVENPVYSLLRNTVEGKKKWGGDVSGTNAPVFAL